MFVLAWCHRIRIMWKILKRPEPNSVGLVSRYIHQVESSHIHLDRDLQLCDWDELCIYWPHHYSHLPQMRQWHKIHQSTNLLPLLLYYLGELLFLPEMLIVQTQQSAVNYWRSNVHSTCLNRVYVNRPIVL